MRATDKIDREGGGQGKGSGRNEGGRMCRYADADGRRRIPFNAKDDSGKHVMVLRFQWMVSRVSHFKTMLPGAFSLRQRCNLILFHNHVGKIIRPRLNWMIGLSVSEC